ncbi:cytochrome c6 [Nannochloropsis oceanica]
MLPTTRRFSCTISLLFVLLCISTTSSTAFFLSSSTPQPGPQPAVTRTALSATPSSSTDQTSVHGNWLRAASFLALTLLPSTLASPAGAFDAKGVKLFENNCASCHVGGGNIIGYARGKTLKEEALVKNKVASRAAIVSMLQQGKGVMPKYGSYTRKNGDVVPAKLSEQEMGIVADYVLEQAKAGWK